ncbi:MAG: hypothetical protein WDM71_06205 [Ferruginibacter sp.]
MNSMASINSWIKAIEVITEQLKTQGRTIPDVPPFPDRVHPK